MKQPTWPLLFPAADPENAAAHFFLPANSHPCSLLQAGQSVPIRARKPFPGAFFWLAAAAVPPGLCVPGPARAWRWQGRQQEPPAHGCQCCWAAQTCPPWHLSLMAAHWLQLCCVFFQGLVSFQALGVHMLSPRHQAWAWGAQVCASLRNAFSGKRQLAAAGVFPGEKGQDKDSV